jgi:hypothetical protein
MHEIGESFRALWEKQPTAAVLLIVGVIVFVFLVADAWYHKHRRKRRR